MHKRELVGQTIRKLADAGLDAGIVAAGFAGSPERPVQVAMIPTLHARAIRTRRMELPSADLLIVDECHHATAKTWRVIIEAYPEARLVGATATPCSEVGSGLGRAVRRDRRDAADCRADRSRLAGAAQGILGARPDLSGVRIQGGDYVEIRARGARRYRPARRRYRFALASPCPRADAPSPSR